MEARVFDRCQEGVQLEMTDVLGSGGHNIGWIQVVPNIVHFTNRDPMISLVTKESVTSFGQVLVLNGYNRDTLVFSTVVKGHLEHLKWIVATISDIVGWNTVSPDSTTHIAAWS